VSRQALVWFFISFGLLIASGALIAGAAISFLASLTPLYLAIALAAGAIVCSLVALARQAGDGE
jgi:hypothetical protein